MLEARLWRDDGWMLSVTRVLHDAAGFLDLEKGKGKEKREGKRWEEIG